MPRAVLPSIGTELELRCQAPGAEVTVRSKTVLVDFTGGCRIRVEADSADSDGAAVLRLFDLRLVAELPDAGGAEDGGTVTLAQDGSTTVEEDGLVVFSLTATIEQPDSTVRLVARNPMRLHAGLGSFPPKGDQCELVEPVDFVLPDNPEATIAQIAELVIRLDEV